MIRQLRRKPRKVFARVNELAAEKRRLHAADVAFASQQERLKALYGISPDDNLKADERDKPG